MSTKSFPDCPVTKLPTVHELLREMYESISKVSDLKAKAKLMFSILDHLIMANDDYLTTVLTHPDWFFATLLEVIKAIPNREEQTEILNEFASIMQQNLWSDRMPDVIRLLEPFGRTELMDKIRVWFLPNWGHNDPEEFYKMHMLITPGTKYHEQAQAILWVREANSGQWTSALGKVNLIKDDRLRLKTLFDIAESRVLRNSPDHVDTVLSILTACEKTLLPLVSKKPKNISVHVMVTHLMKGYQDFGMFEDALEFLRDVRFDPKYRLTWNKLFAAIGENQGAARVYSSLGPMVAELKQRQPVTPDSCQVLLNFYEIARKHSLEELADEILDVVVSFANDEKTPLRDRCSALVSLGYTYHTVKRLHYALATFQQAFQTAEEIQDESIRHKVLVEVALAMAECDFFQESLDIFRKYQDKYSFVVLFYWKTQFEIMEFYDQLSGGDNEAWGYLQRESWLKYILYHLRQMEDHSKRISQLRYYLTDLDSHYSNLGE